MNQIFPTLPLNLYLKMSFLWGVCRR